MNFHCFGNLGRSALATRLGAIVIGVVCTLDSSSVARAQSAGCTASWVSTFGAEPGTNEEVYALIEFDDGSGPALYAGGLFAYAGSVAAPGIAKWNGTSWSSLAGSMTTTSGIAQVKSLAVFDDGSGPALYAGGNFTTAGGVAALNIAKWNGTTWSALGSGVTGFVLALTTYDDGSGNALYAGGDFALAGGSGASRVAKWNGSAWSALGAGVSGGTVCIVRALATFDDGNGAALYVAGNFANAGAGAASNIAKWNGMNWSALGAGVAGGSVLAVQALAEFDDGNGSELYACGSFTTAGGAPANRIAKWNGGSWSTLGSGLTVSTAGVLQAFSLTVADDGTGPALFAGGGFANAGGIVAHNVAKWKSSTWSALGSGTDYAVGALGSVTTGGASVLYCGGAFSKAGGLVAKHIAAWSASNWSSLGAGATSEITAMAVFDSGSGPALFASGGITTAAGAHQNIGKWNGSSWSALGTGIDAFALAMAVFDDGSGPALFVAGNLTSAGGVFANHIAKWDGSNWHALGSGLNYPARALAVFDDGSGPALIAGGEFTLAGSTNVDRIAKWNGTTWSAIAGGLTHHLTHPVHALEVFDDGSGPALFIGGDFLGCVEKWTGASWSSMAGGVNNGVQAFGVFDDGSGAALFVGGPFTMAGGAPASHIAKWNGTSWSALGAGLSGSLPNISGTPTPYALKSFDDGSGAKLYAGGTFASAGGVPAKAIARWDGANWSSVGSGTTSIVDRLAVFDDSSGPALIVGGLFTSAIDSGDSYIAKWGCPFVSSGHTYCTAGTSSTGCVPSISTFGNASATATSGFTISIDQLNGQRTGLLFYGVSGPQATPWGLGGTSRLCVNAPTQRMGLQSSNGTNGVCDGSLVEDWNAYAFAHPTAVGQPFTSGDMVWLQGWYRDPPSPMTTSLSNALAFLLGP